MVSKETSSPNFYIIDSLALNLKNTTSPTNMTESPPKQTIQKKSGTGFRFHAPTGQSV